MTITTAVAPRRELRRQDHGIRHHRTREDIIMMDRRPSEATGNSHSRIKLLYYMSQGWISSTLISLGRAELFGSLVCLPLKNNQLSS